MWDIWWYEVKVIGLIFNNFVLYWIISEKESGENMKSKIFNFVFKLILDIVLKIFLIFDY